MGIFFYPKKAKFRNEINLEKIYKNLEPEKLHLKFLKYILGVHKKSSNFAVLSEFGRYSLSINVIKNMLNFWYRLENSESDSLIFHAYKCSKEMDNYQTSWYSSIKSLCVMLKIPVNLVNVSHGRFKTAMKKILSNEYVNNWYTMRDNCRAGKLETYFLFKTNFGYENYLSLMHNFSHRRALARLRISAHRLPIETGRYSNIPRNNRICTKCAEGEIGDEIHFLLNCSKFHNERKDIIQLVKDENRNFNSLDKERKFIWLMSTENENIIKNLGQFVYKHLDN